MKKTLAIIAAAGLSTAAYADHHQTGETNLIPMGTNAQTENYDGPNTTTAAGQPAPTDTDPKTEATVRYQPQTRTSYQFCSETVRDNCRQRRDPSY